METGCAIDWTPMSTPSSAQYLLKGVDQTVDEIVRIENLRIDVLSKTEVIQPVRGFNLVIEKGDAVGLVGESGSGKTLTGLSIAGLLDPKKFLITADAFVVSGRNMSKLSESAARELRMHSVRMIFQDPMSSLNPVMRIGTQLIEALTPDKRQTRRQAKAEALKLLTDVKIDDPAVVYKKYPHQLSGGMRQRVMIGMSLGAEPELILADEPTTALDVSTQSVVLDLLQELTERFHTSLLFVSHDLSVVARVTRKLLVMYAGMVVETGPTDDIFLKPAHPYTVGLVKSIPRLDDARSEDFYAIPGSMPSANSTFVGCPFAPRCYRKISRCESELPPLMPIANLGSPRERSVRCWNPEAVI